MNLKDMSEVDIISLQYSLLEELKQKKTTKTVSINVESSYDVDEFINQTFKDKDGIRENPYQQLCRKKWFELGCPPLKKFSESQSFKYQTIRKYSSQFRWNRILEQAITLGYNMPNFIDDSKVERDSKQYNRYREKVLKRDGVCQCCGKSEDLEVHHPMPFNQYNSLGADTNNGIVLCKECHSKYHSEYGYKKEANAVTFSLFLRDYGMNPKNELTSNLSSCDLKEIFSVTDLIK